MTITIKCDNCGNSVEVKILPKKYSQFRDELYVKGFHFDIQEPKGEEEIHHTGEIAVVILPVFFCFQSFWSPGPEVTKSRVTGDALEQTT